MIFPETQKYPKNREEINKFAGTQSEPSEGASLRSDYGVLNPICLIGDIFGILPLRALVLDLIY